MPDVYTHTLVDATVEDHHAPLRTHQDVIRAARDDGWPAWALPTIAALALVGVFLVGTAAGHIWSLAFCIDPASFGLPS